MYVFIHYTKALYRKRKKIIGGFYNWNVKDVFILDGLKIAYLNILKYLIKYFNKNIFN